MMYEHTNDKIEHCAIFAEMLMKSVFMYKEISLQPQIDYVNTTFHIEKITEKWNNLLVFDNCLNDKEQEMVKEIRRFYPDDEKGFIEDMRSLRNDGKSIESYYRQLEKKGFICVGGDAHHPIKQREPLR